MVEHESWYPVANLDLALRRRIEAIFAEALPPGAARARRNASILAIKNAVKGILETRREAGTGEDVLAFTLHSTKERSGASPSSKPRSRGKGQTLRTGRRTSKLS